MTAGLFLDPYPRFCHQSKSFSSDILEQEGFCPVRNSEGTSFFVIEWPRAHIIHNEDV